MWEAVQLEIERRRKFSEKYNIGKYEYASDKNPLAGRVVCGHCGSIFGRKVWTSTYSGKRRVIWQCNNKYSVKGEKRCENKHLDDTILYQAFINTFNAMIENGDYFIEKWKEHLKSDNLLQRYKAKQLISIIKNAKPIKEFDINLYFSIIEKMTVIDGKKIVVSLLDGTEIDCEI